MSSISAAMTRDFLSRGRWNFLLGVLGALALPVLIIGRNQLDRTVPPSNDLRIFLSFVTLMIEMLSFGVVLVTAHGTPMRLYPLPATTGMLVVWRLVPSMIAAAAMHVVAMSVLNATYGLSWPVWGPAIFLASAAACMHGALWFAGHTQLSQASAMGLLGSVLGYWLKTRFGEFYARPQHLWTELNAAEILTMTLAAVVGFVLAYEGAARDRRGDAWNWLRLAEWLERCSRTLSSGRKLSLQTPRQAQFAWEWRQKGWLLPAGVAILLAAVLVFCAFGPPNVSVADLPQVAFACGWLLIVGGLVGGMLFGKCSRSYGNQMGSFQASRPATSTDLASAVLKAMARSLLLSWCIWLGMVLLVSGIVSLAVPGWSDQGISAPWKSLFGSLVLALGLSWMLAGIACSVVLTGRPGFIIGTLGGSLGSIIGAMMLAETFLTPEQRAVFHNALLYGLGATFTVGTVVAFVAARAKQFIAPRTPWIVLGVWCVLALAQLGPVRQYVDLQNGAAHAFILGLFALGLAPFATAPLAIAWNRHR